MSERRFFNARERQALYALQDGKCANCGIDLPPGWHADHVQPFAHEGPTDVINGQALCPTCNLRKGATVPSPHDKWQQEALETYLRQPRTDFLVVATPGAGKTRFGLTIFDRERAARTVERLIVMVPTKNLKYQWTAAASKLGIELDPAWENDVGPWPADMDGVVVTYQQLDRAPHIFRKIAREARTLVLLDEIHHCGDNASWGDSLVNAFGPDMYGNGGAEVRIALSGTPFRTDGARIPFVQYVDGVGKSDFDYSYGKALDDGVCRPVYFPRKGGNAEWIWRGESYNATFDDVLSLQDSAKRMRTVLSPSGDWIPAVLRDADLRLREMREDDPDAAGIVWCIDQDHARALAAILTQQTGIIPALVISEDPDASTQLTAFRDATTPWLVSVRMVNEGVDIPRLRVGVFATNTTTEVFFRQVVGRIVRTEGFEGEYARLFIPDDPVLRRFAEEIKRQRDAQLNEEREELGELGERDRADSSSTSFRPVASTVEDRGVIVDGSEHLTPEEIATAERLKKLSPITAALANEQVALVLRAGRNLPATASVAAPPPTQPKADRKKRLRTLNQKAAQQIVFRHGGEFADVNFRANQVIDVQGVKQCTEDQLRRRLELLQRWLEEGPPDD